MSIAAQAADRTLLALISDEDTATGLLLAGIGHISTSQGANGQGAQAGQGGKSGGGGQQQQQQQQSTNITQDSSSSSKGPSPDRNFFIVNTSTPVSDIEAAFNLYTQERQDIGILLITQTLAEKIRPLCDRYQQAFPAVLEIPSKDAPYGQ